MKRIAILAIAVVALAVAAAAPAASKPGTIVDVAAGDKQFSTLVSLVQKAGLVKALSSKKGKLTVFAPTNAAFAKLGKKTLKAVGKDKKLLRSILLYHVVKGAVPASTVVTLNGKRVKTLNGKKVKITIRKGPKVYVNSSRVIKTDVKASNGIVHVINKVLIPPAH